MDELDDDVLVEISERVLLVVRVHWEWETKAHVCGLTSATVKKTQVGGSGGGLGLLVRMQGLVRERCPAGAEMPQLAAQPTAPAISH